MILRGSYKRGSTVEATAQMAADTEAIGLSRVHMYESKCILSILLILLECTQSADNLFHSFTMPDHSSYDHIKLPKAIYSDSVISVFSYTA